MVFRGFDHTFLRLALLLAVGVSIRAGAESDDFTTGRTPLFAFAISEIPQERVSRKLIDPAEALPQTFRYPHRQIERLYQYSQNCDPHLAKGIADPRLRKALLWHRFLCGSERLLPDSFFSSSPFVHPDGSSFAQHALQSRPRIFGVSTWIEAHLDQFHVLEMSDDKIFPFASPLQKLLLQLGADALSSLLRESAVIETDSYVLIRTDVRAKTSLSVIYRGYPVREWKEHVRAKVPYTVPLVKGLIVSLLGGLLLLMLGRWVASRRERRARLFMLQMLTHELRTPATTLRLGIEAFRRKFDHFPEELQSEFLRMADEVQRLGRLLETSTQYLQSGLARGSIRFERNEITSLNEYLSWIVDPYEARVRFEPLTEDIRFRLDPYWLGICLRNLIDNALRHGKPPVEVRCSQRKHGRLLIDIIDGGTLSSKSPNAGLGLGLSIVENLVRQMKGRLRFRSHPTTFSIQLRDMYGTPTARG